MQKGGADMRIFTPLLNAFSKIKTLWNFNTWENITANMQFLNGWEPYDAVDSPRVLKLPGMAIITGVVRVGDVTAASTSIFQLTGLPINSGTTYTYGYLRQLGKNQPINLIVYRDGNVKLDNNNSIEYPKGTTCSIFMVIPLTDFTIGGGLPKSILSPRFIKKAVAI